MPTVQARRTLVKSPPELWAELSDAESLARRLQPLGEIRITRLEPEKRLSWEGERARGTVEIEPSGWGTRVTLTAEPSEVEDPEPATEPDRRPHDVPERPPTEPEAHASPEVQELPQTTAALGQGFATTPPLPPLPGRFPVAPGRLVYRLFGFRRWPGGSAPRVEEPEPVSEPPPAEPRPVSVPDPPTEPTTEPDLPPPEPPTEPDIPPRPEPPLEPAADGHRPGNGGAYPALDGPALHEVLGRVLDELGAAHHRPFSRG
jgi:hypothetical protein